MHNLIIVTFPLYNVISYKLNSLKQAVLSSFCFILGDLTNYSVQTAELSSVLNFIQLSQVHSRLTQS